MKKCWIAIVFFLLALFANAQQYKVYSVTGKVSADGKAVETKQMLSTKSILSIPKGGKIILFDGTRNMLTTLKTEGKGTVASLLKISGNTEKELSGSYLSFIIQKMTSDDEKNNTYMQSAGSAYRDSDNLLGDSISVDSIRMDENKSSQ